jgi:hypothetical protein
VEGGGGAGRVLKKENLNNLELQNENAGPTRIEIGVITRGERRRKSHRILRIPIKMFVYLFIRHAIKIEGTLALHALINN